MSVYPTWSAGSRITADKLTAGQTMLIQKTSDEIVTSSTTIQDDDELFVALAANASYVIDAWIFAYQGAASATDIDINTQWSVPSGATGWKFCLGPTSGMTSRDNTAMICSLNGFTTNRVYGLGNSSNGVTIHEHLIVNTAATSGNAKFRWCQGTSNSLGTTVGAQSHLIVARLA